MSNPIGTTYKNNNEFSVRDTAIKDEKTETNRDKDKPKFKGLEITLLEIKEELNKSKKELTEAGIQEIRNKIDQLEKPSELKRRCVYLKAIANHLISIERENNAVEKETPDSQEKIDKCKKTINKISGSFLHYDNLEIEEKNRINQLILETAISIKTGLMPYNDALRLSIYLDLADKKTITGKGIKLEEFSMPKNKNLKETLDLIKETKKQKTSDAFLKAIDMLNEKIKSIESKGKPEPDIDKS